MRCAKISCALGAVGLIAVSGAAARAETVHAESDDAGDGIASWQFTHVGPLGSELVAITGATSSQAGDYVDAFIIEITDPDQFFATTTSGTSFDTMLYLFDLEGNGLLANDDVSGASTRSTLTNASDDGTGVVVDAGLYILAVTGFQMDAADVLGQVLFDIPIGSLTEVSGPDGAGGGNRITEWQDNTVLGSVATGSYTIGLRGVSAVPTPGVVGIAGAAGLGMGVRRRRRV